MRRTIQRLTDLVRPFAFALLAACPVLAQSGDIYKITITLPGANGLATDCASEGYLLARWGGGNQLHADGAILDADGSPGPELFLNTVSDIGWTRKYEAGQGLTGTFNGCYGETYGANSYSGNLFIYFRRTKGRDTIDILWHFAYYTTPGNVIREHFTLRANGISYPAWTGGTLEADISGTFDVQYYLKEGKKIVSLYESITGGAGRPFSCRLRIERLN